MTEDTFDSLKKERDELKKFISEKTNEAKRRRKLGDIFVTAFLGFAFWCVVDYLRHISTIGLEYAIKSGGVDQMTGVIYLGMVGVSIIFLWAFGLYWFIGTVHDIFKEDYPEVIRRVNEAFKAFSKNEKDL